MTRRRRRIALFLASVAIGLQALWPLLAQAKPGSATLVPVCTVEGVTHYIELPAANTPLEERSSSSHEHCAFCMLAADRISCPSAAESWLLVAADISSVVLVSLPAPRMQLLARSPGRPRAPPVIP